MSVNGSMYGHLMLVRSVVLVFEGVLDGAGPPFVVVEDRLVLG